MPKSLALSAVLSLINESLCTYRVCFVCFIAAFQDKFMVDTINRIGLVSCVNYIIWAGTVLILEALVPLGSIRCICSRSDV